MLFRSILNKAGIHEAVGGTRVNKCRNAERRVGNKLRGQGNVERVGIGKSRHIESDNLGKCTERVNAVLRLCGRLGTAQSFFESEDSLAWMAQALALEVDDEDFRQSFAEWLGPPQNMHKLLLKWIVFPAGSTFRLCQACWQWMWSFQRRTEVSCFC